MGQIEPDDLYTALLSRSVFAPGPETLYRATSFYQGSWSTTRQLIVTDYAVAGRAFVR